MFMDNSVTDVFDSYNRVFRQRFLAELKTLFVQMLLIAHEMGTLKLGTVSLDGTKIKANASKHKALSWGHANALEAQLRAEVAELMRLAEAADNTPPPDTLDIPAEIQRRQDRLAAIAAAKQTIQARAHERDAQAQAEYEAKLERRARRAGQQSGSGWLPPSTKPFCICVGACIEEDLSAAVIPF